MSYKDELDDVLDPSLPDAMVGSQRELDTLINRAFKEYLNEIISGKIKCKLGYLPLVYDNWFRMGKPRVDPWKYADYSIMSKLEDLSRCVPSVNIYKEGETEQNNALQRMVIHQLYDAYRDLYRGNPCYLVVPGTEGKRSLEYEIEVDLKTSLPLPWDLYSTLQLLKSKTTDEIIKTLKEYIENTDVDDDVRWYSRTPNYDSKQRIGIFRIPYVLCQVLIDGKLKEAERLHSSKINKHYETIFREWNKDSTSEAMREELKS